VTRSGMVMGTAHYIAPEQALGHEAEPASDVYSLAVVGYECLVGHRPFLSENAVTVAMMHIRDVPPPLPPDVPPGVRALLEATLVKDPRHRYRSGGEFALAVAAVRAGLPLPTPSGLALAQAQQAAVQAGPPQAGPGTMPPSQPVPPPPGVATTGTFLGVPPQRMRPPRQRNPLWILVVVLVVALVALGVWAITQAVRHAGTGTPHLEGQTGQAGQTTGQKHTGAAGSQANGGTHLGSGTVVVEQATYRGEHADTAVGQLTGLGLRTSLTTTFSGPPAKASTCVVDAVTPSGELAIGTVVTVTCTPEGNTR
jgi:eukaryotic-like serine/threonine-protein kinase